MRLVSSFVTAVSLVVLLPLAVASATSVIWLDDRELTARSDQVVLGRVVAARSFVGKDDRIRTEYGVEVYQALKGAEPAEPLVLRTLGGVVEGRGLAIPGSPLIELDEELVLFVRKGDAPGVRYLVGFSQGKLPVRADPHTGQRVVARDLRGVGLVQFDHRGQMQLKRAPDGPIGFEPLDDFVGRIESYVRAEEAGR